MADRLINKRSFLLALDCRTWGWFEHNRVGGSAPTDGERFRMEEGKRVHERARSLHPGALFAGGADATRRLIEDASAEVVHEAASEAPPFVTRADWIRREGDGWVVGEVKSSLHNDEGPKDEHIDDLAYTVMVLRRAGLPVAGAELILMNRDWRLGMEDAALFVVSDHTDDVFERAAEFGAIADEIAAALTGEEPPPARLCLACRDCPHFEERCVGVEIPVSVLCLPGLRAELFAELDAMGAHALADVPEGFGLTPRQSSTLDAHRRGRPVVGEVELLEAFAGVEHPIGYLDFETVKTALPLFDGVAPHEQVVTQYSLHRREEAGGPLSHREHLADHAADGRRGLAEALLSDAAGCRTVVVYSSFERTMIRGLARRFPDLAPELEALDDRLFDLLPLVRSHYVDPRFRGSASLKVVLPVLCPQLSYDGLNIADGDAAIVAFAKMAMGEIAAERIDGVRRDLLAYCELDTLAMVELHAFLEADVALDP